MAGPAASATQVQLSRFSPFRSWSMFGLRTAPPADSQVGESDAWRDYSQLASGLSQVLAGYAQKNVERDFGAAAQALRSLRRQLRSPFAEPVLAAETLNDLAHEIALEADAATRSAAARCLRRAVAARRVMTQS